MKTITITQILDGHKPATRFSRCRSKTLTHQMIEEDKKSYLGTKDNKSEDLQPIRDQRLETFPRNNLTNPAMTITDERIILQWEIAANR